MNNVVIKLGGTEYPMCTTLRAAYAIQGKFGHKPYTQIFKDFNTMDLESQIKMLYAAYELANKDSGSLMSLSKFQEAILDEYGLLDLFDVVNDLMECIMAGNLSPDEVAEKKARMAERAAKNA